MKIWQTVGTGGEAFALLARSDVIVPALLQKERFESTANLVRQMADIAGTLLFQKERLDKVFELEIYAKDGRNWHNKLKKQYSSFFSRLFSKDYKTVVTELRLASRSGKKFAYEEAVEQTGVLRDYQQSLADFGERERQLEGMLGAAYKGVASDWRHIQEELGCLEALYGRGLAFVSLASMDGTAFAGEKQSFASYAERLSSLRASYSGSVAVLEGSFDTAVFDLSHSALPAVLAKCESCFAEMGKIDNWVRFTRLLRGLEEKGAAPYIAQVIADKVPAQLIVDAYRKAFYTQLLHALISATPEFDSFTRVSQDKAVALFSEKDKLQFEISKIQIQEKLSSQRPSLDMLTAKSPVSVLLREGEKKRKQKSIRNLIAETGDLVQVLKPCFLMSPLSVSMFLSNAISFDTVVFDEASQIFPQDAVGAVYRGKQLIVVGDSKQMPPSNFFTATLEVEDDEDLEDVMDFESILDMCTPSLPQSFLLWHYRSRYEQLIAFSNRNFYGGNLMTFPSASGGVEGTGVDYYYVDGTFDRRSHTNLAEAERVVDLVFEDIQRYPERSLGVVAFSVAQQNLIDSLLMRRRRLDVSHEDFFSHDKERPFFIKNLETVQGDERDTIIFSVAYGKDAQGKLLHNFGPLNRQGGERRLNVAVTRAKTNVQLVSSMHGADIDMGRTSSEGARLLKEYLDYAERGEKALGSGVSAASSFSMPERELEASVADFLRGKGYDVEMQVGCGSSKIDIGIKRKDGSYALAVECDGATYRNAANARDRDRLRREVLERMGWHYYRVWSTDWFKNTQIEKGRLLRAAEAALSAPAKLFAPVQKLEAAKPVAAAAEPGATKQEAAAGLAERAPEEHLAFPVYVEADIAAIVRAHGDVARNFHRIMKEILAVEAPLAEEYLLKRIPFLFGREKVTSTVKQQFEDYMQGCEAHGIIRRDGFLYLAGTSSYELRIPGAARDIKYIALEELASGIYTILTQNISADKESLYRTLVTALGFSRAGDAMNARLDAALVRLQGVVHIDGQTISLK